MLCGLLLVITACSQTHPGAEVPLDRAREYASALYNQQLYWQAVDEYENILDRYSMGQDIRANLNYQIANIYFEKIGDIPHALSYYLKIRHLYQESSLMDDVNKRVVACLERLGKSTAAAEYLKESAEAAGSDSPIASLPGDTLAVIGETVLTTGDFDRLFDYFWTSLPEDQRKEDPTREQKLAFLRDYVKSETLYNSAKRQRLDMDKEVVEVAYLQKKQLMIQKLLENEVNSKIKVEDAEIKNFYNENKDKLSTTVDGKKKQLSLSEAREYIRQLLVSQKARELQDELTDRLIESQNAKIFADKIQ